MPVRQSNVNRNLQKLLLSKTGKIKLKINQFIQRFEWLGSFARWSPLKIVILGADLRWQKWWMSSRKSKNASKIDADASEGSTNHLKNEQRLFSKDMFYEEIDEYVYETFFFLLRMQMSNQTIRRTRTRIPLQSSSQWTNSYVLIISATRHL